MTLVGHEGLALAADDDEKVKKDHTFLIRVEKDVHEFFLKEARRRRMAIAQILRELIYREFDRSKGNGNG